MSARRDLAVGVPVLLIALACLAPARARAGATEREQPSGYEHDFHDGKVSVVGLAGLACERCHRVDGRGYLVGRPDHVTCFGDCHGPPPPARRPGKPYPLPDASRQVCETCHAPAALDRAMAGGREPLTVAYPPYLADRDFGMHLSHRGHAGATRDTGDCLACHRLPAAPASASDTGPPAAGGRVVRGPRAAAPRKAHARCVGCHASAVAAPDRDGAGKPMMNECIACHVAEIGPRAQPFLSRGIYAVTGTFSHPAHQARGARDCRTCHANILTGDGNVLATPSMATCSTCHDGKRAFSTVTPDCRRCHAAPRAGGGLRPPTGARFDHGKHAERASDIPCVRCHRLDARGVPQAPAGDHAPCSDAGCHRDDFALIAPKICGACHVGIEPWRALHFDRARRPESEFGARFSHRAHRVVCPPDAPDCASKPCESCHLRHRDHQACMGAGCHAERDTVAPALTDCQGCHEAGLLARRRAARTSGRWSVRARFGHEPHRQDPRNSAPLPCTACHVGVGDAIAIADIPAPTKATCQGCHDGAIAFKVTGHGCVRCHAPGSRPDNPGSPGSPAGPESPEKTSRPAP